MSIDKKKLLNDVVVGAKILLCIMPGMALGIGLNEAYGGNSWKPIFGALVFSGIYLAGFFPEAWKQTIDLVRKFTIKKGM